jgi:hypothetical protein
MADQEKYILDVSSPKAESIDANNQAAQDVGSTAIQGAQESWSPSPAELSDRQLLDLKDGGEIPVYNPSEQNSESI